MRTSAAVELVPSSRETAAAERYFVASQWQLVCWKFRKHKMALVAGVVLGIMYFIAAFCEFLSPYLPGTRFPEYLFAPPQRVRLLSSAEGFGPYVYGLVRGRDPETFRRTFTIDREQRFNVRFFVRAEEYRLWGLFKSDIHLFGSDDGPVLLFGAERLGRDVFSRILYGARISLSVGLVGILFTFVFGMTLGGLSGYLGGTVDHPHATIRLCHEAQAGLRGRVQEAARRDLARTRQGAAGRRRQRLLDLPRPGVPDPVRGAEAEPGQHGGGTARACDRQEVVGLHGRHHGLQPGPLAGDACVACRVRVTGSDGVEPFRGGNPVHGM